MNITTSQLRQYGRSPDGKLLAATAQRKKRGDGKASLRKAAIAKRLPEVLALLGVDRLPDGVEVNAFPGQQNGHEKKFGETLGYLWERSCKSDLFAFQPIRLCLARGVVYLPDWIYRMDGITTVYEVKGERHAAGIAKFKIAREKFPQFAFVMISLERNRWQEVRLSGKLPGIDAAGKGKKENNNG